MQQCKCWQCGGGDGVSNCGADGGAMMLAAIDGAAGVRLACAMAAALAGGDGGAMLAAFGAGGVDVDCRLLQLCSAAGGNVAAAAMQVLLLLL